MCQGILDMKEEVRQETTDQNRLESIVNIMDSFKLTAQQAMEALKIPDDQWSKYCTLLMKK